MNPHFISTLTICRTCAGIAGLPPWMGYNEQACYCHRDGQRPWSDKDFNEYTVLCWCCQLEAIASGSRWDSYFCKRCRGHIDAFHAVVGASFIPRGRHSLMNGIGVRDPDAADQIRALADFAVGMAGFQDVMRNWRPGRLQAVLKAVGLYEVRDSHPANVPVPDYLEAAAGLADDEQLGHAASVRAMAGFLGLPWPQELPDGGAGE